MNGKRPTIKRDGGATYLVPPMIPPSSNKDRAIYNSLLRGYAERGIRPVITQSYLRLEQTLGNSNSVPFQVLTNQGNVQPTEVRLQLTDTFVVTDIGFFISKLATNAARSSMVLDTFVNPEIYTGSGEAAALQALYNGQLTAGVDRKTYITAWDLLRHYYVPNAQRLLAQVGSTNVPAGAATSYSRSGFENDQIFKEILPTFNISGNQSLNLAINLPEAVNMAGTNSINIAVLYLRGFLVQNVTQ